LELALKVLDDDNSGRIELNEFKNWWKREDRWQSIQLQGDELAKRQIAAEVFNSFDSGKLKQTLEQQVASELG
jgi:Ca2+-binding EF-hand superfamily protein